MTHEKTEILVNTIQRLSLTRDMSALMEIVRGAARKLTGSDGATFILKDNRLCYYADEDAIGPLWKGQRFPMEACISGWSMINKKPVVIEDIYSDDRIPVDAYKPTFVKSLAMVPIRTIEPVGAIGNYWATPHKASDDELFLLQSLADVISVAIENIRVYSELEQRVQERTQQLEEANKTLQSFNYSVSHDLRAPLRVFHSYSRILLDKHSQHLNDDGKMLLTKMEAQATNMSKVLTGLMDFSKVGMAILAHEEIPMAAIVKELCDNIHEIEKERDITFDIGDLPAVKGDPLLMKQVWSNLISNAVKYTSKKKNTMIEIGAKLPSGELTYFIKDNGDGFDMRYADKLFGVFQRLHSQSEFEGNGIGLALSEKIIAKHGGRIWTDSKPGEGATFYFALPQ